MAVVDVVVVNYNSGPWLRKVIAALNAQTFRDFRAIVVDNGSTDRSLEDLPIGSTPIELVRRGRNVGFAAANNDAIRNYVRAKWVALLNPDAFPRGDWLERFLFAADGHYPDYNFFGCRMLDANDPTRIDGVGDVYHVSGLPWREGQGCLDTAAYGKEGEIFSPCAAAALYRTEDVIDAGLFDEDFFCYCEDVDLGFRLRLRGGRCLYVPDAIVEHVGSGIAGKSSDFQLYHGHRNLVWTYLKNMPGWLFWFYLPLHLIVNCHSVLVFALRGQGRTLWRAKLDAMKGLRATWHKRRKLQSERRCGTTELRRVMRGGRVRNRCRT